MGYGLEFIIPALIAAAASTAGTYATNRAANSRAEAAAEADRRERFRQAEMQRQADVEIRRGIQQFTPEQHQQEIQQAAATREAAMQPAAAGPDAYTSTTVAAPVEVKGDLDRRLGEVMAGGRQEAARRALLAAYGDTSALQGRQINRLGENVRRTIRDSVGSTGVNNLERRSAMEGAGDNWALGADLANTVGQIGTYYATRRTPPQGIGYGAASLPPGNGPY